MYYCERCHNGANFYVEATRIVDIREKQYVTLNLEADGSCNCDEVMDSDYMNTEIISEDWTSAIKCSVCDRAVPNLTQEEYNSHFNIGGNQVRSARGQPHSAIFGLSDEQKKMMMDIKKKLMEANENGSI